MRFFLILNAGGGIANKLTSARVRDVTAREVFQLVYGVQVNTKKGKVWQLGREEMEKLFSY